MTPNCAVEDQKRKLTATGTNSTLNKTGLV